MRRIATFVVALGACQFSENRYAARQVSRDELVGSWTATDFAIQSMMDVGVSEDMATREQTMVLRSDGTCEVRTILGLPGVPTDSAYRVYETGCTWQLGEIGHQVLELELNPPLEFGFPYYYFAEEDGRLIIWQYASDPDAWRYMEYERRGG